MRIRLALSLRSLLVVVGASVLCVVAYANSIDCAAAATTGLWKFDTLADVSDSPTSGLTLFDSSGNAQDFVSYSNFGTVLLDDAIPAIAPAGSLSLNSASGGGRLFSTPSSNLFNWGTTGALSVEFRYKATQVTPSIGYVLGFESGASGPTAGDWGLYTSSDGSMYQYQRKASGFTQVPLGIGASDGNWHHVAFTVDSAGTMRSYLDGMLKNSALAGPAPTSSAGVLKFAREENGDGFGNLGFLMDDLRISNVSLAPGAGTGVGELAYAASLSTAPNPDVRPADFAQQWVRTHDFTIGAWGFTNHPTLYTAANFNTALGGGYQAANTAGVESQYLGALLTLNDETRTTVHTALNGGVNGFLLADEAPPAAAPGIHDVAQYIRSIDSETLLIVGLGSSTPANVDYMINTVQPDAVVHGWYPYQGLTQATDEFAGHLDDIAQVRERALFHNKPYFAFIQSFEDFLTGANGISDNRRLPTESELRADVFSKLSAGVKGLYYFVFEDTPNEDRALISSSGTPSPLYAPAAALNAEIAVLGQALRFLESTDWRFRSGGSASQDLVPTWTSSAGSGLIDAVTFQGPSVYGRDALVGYFTDDDGGDYFMLVNTFHGDSLNASQAAVSITLQFDPSLDRVWRWNRLSGESEELMLNNGMLQLTLPGGTGDLFKFGDGRFAGPYRIWRGGASDPWTDDAKWNVGVAPNGLNDRAVFAGETPTLKSVVIDSTVTARSLEFDSAGPHQLVGAGNMTLLGSGSAPQILVKRGDHRLDVALAVPGDLEIATTGASSRFVLGGPVTVAGDLVTVSGPGTVVFNGVTSLAVGGQVVNSGAMAGRGRFQGDLENRSGAVLMPGDGVGTLTVDGDFKQELGGTLQVELAGLTSGTQHDTLHIGGAALIAGDLEVVLQSFVPAVGAEFEIVRATQISGTFSKSLGRLVSSTVALGIVYRQDGIELVATHAGDVNIDGIVNIFDINAVSSHWQSTRPEGDANSDGTVNIFDINLISANWRSGAQTAVPEPSSALMLMLGTVIVLSKVVPRRRYFVGLSERQGRA